MAEIAPEMARDGTPVPPCGSTTGYLGQDAARALSGAQFRELREERRLKRPDVAEGTGLTVSQVARVESSDVFKPGEYEALARFFGVAGFATWDEPAADEDPGVGVHTEWRGLKPGDTVLLVGEPTARYDFRNYTVRQVPGKDLLDVYVTVEGGVGARRRTRPVKPEKVLRLGGTPVVPR